MLADASRGPRLGYISHSNLYVNEENNPHTHVFLIASLIFHIQPSCSRYSNLMQI